MLIRYAGSQDITGTGGGARILLDCVKNGNIGAQQAQVLQNRAEAGQPLHRPRPWQRFFNRAVIR